MRAKSGVIPALSRNGDALRPGGETSPVDPSARTDESPEEGPP